MIRDRVAASLQHIKELGSAWTGELPASRRPYELQIRLNHLVEAGLLEAESRGRPGIDRRKYYSLTPAGHAALKTYHDSR